MSEELTYRDYWNNVDGIVEDALEIGKESGDEDDVYQSIEESVDGNYWVIYTHAAAQGLIFSDNEDALFDVTDLGDVDGYSDVMTKLMYWALRQDVMDRLPSDWQEQIQEEDE